MNHRINATKASRESTVNEHQPVAPPLPPPLERSTHERIAHRAYQLYIESGSLPNHCQQNWEHAERILEAEAVTARSQIGAGREQAPAPFDAATPILMTARPAAAPRTGKHVPVASTPSTSKSSASKGGRTSSR